MVRPTRRRSFFFRVRMRGGTAQASLQSLGAACAGCTGTDAGPCSPGRAVYTLEQLYLQSMVPSERAVVGSYLGPYDDYEEMLAFAAANGVAPQVELFPVGEINSAIARVRDNEARYRVVLRMEEDEED